jgi:hypothetical protein
LSRSMPFGVGALIEPMVDRIARDSITRTLDNVRRTYGAPLPTRTASAQ